jgi:RIO kinase 1
LDAEDLETRNFEKFRSKPHKLTGKQSVTQLVAHEVDPADPDAKFENPDLNELAREGFLDELISGIKTGKEASVFLGKNSAGLVAVKIYTDLRARSFKHDEAYRKSRFIGDARIQKAIEQGSQKGLAARQSLWVQEEFRQMQHLYEHGVRVPKAIAVNGLALVMEFIGDEDGTPAPRISDLKMEQAEAEAAFRQSVQNLKRIVKSGRVHGDYSAFNILWHQAEAVVIDFPQVLEFEHNPNANIFLARDVRSLCKSFMKQGVKADEAKVLREVRRH